MKKVYTVPELREILSPVFDRCGIRRAVLFGSYVKGTATGKSDVDLLDVAHIQTGSRIEREIRDTGITVYMKK